MIAFGVMPAQPSNARTRWPIDDPNTPSRVSGGNRDGDSDALSSHCAWRTATPVAPSVSGGRAVVNRQIGFWAPPCCWLCDCDDVVVGCGDDGVDEASPAPGSADGLTTVVEPARPVVTNPGALWL